LIEKTNVRFRRRRRIDSNAQAGGPKARKKVGLKARVARHRRPFCGKKKKRYERGENTTVGKGRREGDEERGFSHEM